MFVYFCHCGVLTGEGGTMGSVLNRAETGNGKWREDLNSPLFRPGLLVKALCRKASEEPRLAASLFANAFGVRCIRLIRC